MRIGILLELLLWKPDRLDQLSGKLYELPRELLELTGQIAENVHEIRARGSTAEGWTYGPVRDDEKKTTPCLVPYDRLPEGEKAYDRNTALETLKLITALGYKIEKTK